MWKDIILYSISSVSSMVFNYFNTKQMCEENNHELVTLSILNLVMVTLTMCLVLLKSPIKVVDNRVDLQ